MLYFYSLDESQKSDYNTVIITTEDYNQRIAQSNTWENVESFSRVRLPNTGFELIDPFGLSIEDQNDDNPSYPVRFGKEYLFDGDIKGSQRLENFKLGWPPAQYTFIAGPRAMQDLDGNQMYFVLDIQEKSIVGGIAFICSFEPRAHVKPDHL